MRILHLLNDIHQLGNGIINVAVDLACLQAQSGHAVSVASGGGEYESLLVKYGVQHFFLDQSRHLITLLQAAIHYRQLIKTLQPDIVHAHMMTGVVLAYGLRFTSSYKLVATVHNEFQRSAIFMGLADRVIAVSQAVADSMTNRGIPRSTLRVVKNGTIGTPRWRRSSSITANLHHPAITTVAGMYERKGITDLIMAFEHIAPTFSDAHLYLVGDGPDRAKYEQQAQRSSVGDRIHFAGFQPDPMCYLQASDIFVLASRREPFGLVLAEAREAGCAIVATQVDGIPEALDQGNAGVLVPAADPIAIAAKLQMLLSDREQLTYWQHQAQQNLDWLSVERVNQETLDIYQELNLLKIVPQLN